MLDPFMELSSNFVSFGGYTVSNSYIYGYIFVIHDPYKLEPREN